MTDSQLVKIEALLLRIAMGVEELNRATANANRQAKTATLEDRAVLKIILPAIYGALESNFFAIKDLGASSMKHPEIAEAIRKATGGELANSGKRLGKLFRRTSGCVEGGLQISSIGRTRDGTLWKVREFDRR